MTKTEKLKQALDQAKVNVARWEQKALDLEEQYRGASGQEIGKILKDTGMDVTELKALLQQMTKQKQGAELPHTERDK